MAGQHGVDILATFMGTKTGIAVAQNMDKTFPDFGMAYQSYLLSHALTGDPNKYRLKSGPSPTVPWETVGSLDHDITVVDAGPNGFTTTQDAVNSKEACDFWLNLFAHESKTLGMGNPSF
jgi:hypothetical protein